jgi:hypothetical protein
MEVGYTKPQHCSRSALLIMNVDTAISKNGCKPRGRPRKHPSDDHRMNVRHNRLITTLHEARPERPTNFSPGA